MIKNCRTIYQIYRIKRSSADLAQGWLRFCDVNFFQIMAVTESDLAKNVAVENFPNIYMMKGYVETFIDCRLATFPANKKYLSCFRISDM